MEGLGRFHYLQQELQAHIMGMVPELSKLVLKHGEEKKDTRSILGLSKKNWGPRPGATMQTDFHYNTTPEFRLHVKFQQRLTVDAECQVTKINQAMYPYPEIISMMLEQCDYWERDAPVIVEWALAYINGDFDSSF